MKRLPAGLTIVATLTALVSLIFAVQLIGSGDTAFALDTDSDGFADAVELALGSLPADGSSTPEHAALPLTCGDGLDNDGDGDTDFDGNDDGCILDSDSDGTPDMVEVDLQSKPFVAIGLGSTPEDLAVDPGLSAGCADFQDNDGDSTTDTGGSLPPDDFGCQDTDSDGFSDERELAHGSDPNSDTSTPENLLVAPTTSINPSADHVCLDGMDNDGDGLTDLEDDSCRIVLRMDMDTRAISAASGVQVCRPMPASVGIGATIEMVIENVPPMFGMDADILYSLSEISGVTSKAAESASAPPGGHPNFYRKFDPSITVFNGSEDFENGGNPADGVYSTFLGDLGLTGSYGIGTQFQNTTLGGAGLGGGMGRLGVTTIGGQTSGTVTNVDYDPTTLIIRDVANGTVVSDIGDSPSLPGGILAHNPISIFNGMFEFLTAPSACSGAALDDGDSDGVPDLKDNCPTDANPAQADDDFDGIGNACDVPPANITIDQSVNGPTTVDVSQNFEVTVTKILHNIGPASPVEVDIAATATPPDGCSVVSGPTGPTTVTLTASQPVTVDEMFTLHCAEPSDHTFTFDNDVTPTDPNITDPDGATASSTHTVAAIATADIKITQTVSGPSTATVGQDFDVTVTKVLHNNDAFSADASISASATAPAGCTVAGPVGPTTATLPPTTDVTVDEVFTLNCATTGSKTFTFDNDIQTTDPHVVDDDGAQASDTLTVTIEQAVEADIKITQSISGPASVLVSENFAVTVTKVLHNNGPASPVTVDIAATASAPDGCSVVEGPSGPTTVSLTASQPETITEMFTLHCSEPSSHTFTFANVVTPEEGITDPDGATASGTHTITAIAPVDIKIVSHIVGGATTANGGLNFNVTVTKVLENNGAFGAAVTIDADATAPAGCTVVSVPDFDSTTLPPTQPVTVLEIFTLNCTESGLKTFTLTNDIQTTDPHIVDLDGAQSSDSVPITVAAVLGATPTPTPTPSVLPATGSGPDGGGAGWIPLILASALLVVGAGAATWTIRRQRARRREG